MQMDKKNKGYKMQINFKGIKNAGAHTKLNKEDLAILEEGGRRFGIPKGKLSVISLELTNEGNKDLDEFKEILKNYPNCFNPNMLNLDIQEQLEYKKTQFMINGKAIKMNRENLKIFAKIFRLLDKISKMPNEKLKVENEHITKPETIASYS
jgi:hypothetical protein